MNKKNSVIALVFILLSGFSNAACPPLPSSIQTEEGLFDCLVYIASDNDMGKPQAEYIERINTGIKSANLPDDYVDYVD